MRVVVLGASGGVGRWAVRAAVDAGHDVVAGARSRPEVPPGAIPVAVDVRDRDAVAGAVAGADAVLWCVGVTKRSGPGVGRTGLSNLVEAAGADGLRRLVTVSGAGVTLAGDDKGLGARAVSALTRRLARDLVADKEAEHAVLAASGLAWTEVRPPRLVERAGTGRWMLTGTAPGPTAKPVPKADVAAAMLALADDPLRGGPAGGSAAVADWVRQSPFLVAG